MFSHNYGAAREILKLFEILGWIVASTGCLLMIVGFANASWPFFPAPSDPTFIDRIAASIPGLLFVEGGLIHVALVKVGLANIDTAEMTKELLEIARKPTPVVVHSAKSNQAGKSASPAPTNNRKESTSKPTKEGEQVYAETYKGMPIYQRFDGYYVGEKWFFGIKPAWAYIDELAAE